MAKYFDMMKVKFVDKGIPVVIGEYGASARTGITEIALHNASREYWYKTVVQYAVNRGLIPYVWDTGDLINRNTGSVKDQGAIQSIMEGAGLFSPAYFKLDTTVIGDGSINLSPNLSRYKSGSIVTVTAKAGTKAQFNSWSGVINGSTNSTTLVVKANYSITANFSAKVEAKDSLSYDYNVEVYPNPYSSTFILKFSQPEDSISVVIYDLKGNKVESINSLSGSNTVTMGASLSSGLYVVRVESKKYNKIFKIIKE